MDSLLNINNLDNKKDQNEQFNSTNCESAYNIIKYIKKIELPIRMQFRILIDGRIGGKEYQNYKDFVFLNP